MAEALPPPPEYGGLESGRSSPSPAASPEFEFWMVGKNPSSFPSPALLTADELFSGGVVLPLHTLQASDVAGGEDGEGGSESADLEPPAAEAEEEAGEEEAAQPLAESGITPTPDLPAVTFKWKDIFKAGGGGEAKERKKMERRVSSVSGNAELININIWPFSRSRSAGALSRAKPTPPSASANANANANASVVVNGNGAAPTVSSAPAAAAPAPAARKVSSAPCSRSNSRGESGPEPVVAIPAAAVGAAVAEAATAGQAAPVAGATTSMLRRLVPGHNRNNNNAGGGGGATGIRLGRPSPVWQLRRNKLQQTAAEQKQAGAKKKAAAAATTSDDKAPGAAGCRNNAEGGEEGGPNPPQGLFGLRTFFSKKVY